MVVGAFVGDADDGEIVGSRDGSVVEGAPVGAKVPGAFDEMGGLSITICPVGLNVGMMTATHSVHSPKSFHPSPSVPGAMSHVIAGVLTSSHLYALPLYETTSVVLYHGSDGDLQIF